MKPTAAVLANVSGRFAARITKHGTSSGSYRWSFSISDYGASRRSFFAIGSGYGSSSKQNGMKTIIFNS